MSVNLDRIKIAKPCSQSWAEMDGDDRVRNCAACELCVFNISELTRLEATDLIQSRAKSGLRTCIRLHRRQDGTVITKDCPLGTSQHTPVAKTVRNAAAAAAVAVVAAACGNSGADPVPGVVGTPQPIGQVDPTPAIAGELMVEMGDFCEVPVGEVPPPLETPVKPVVE